MKNKVYTNASIVTGLSVAERALGFLYRIVLSRLIGAEGLGIYQVALSLFGLFITIGTGGLPITVSRMITKHKAENNPHRERSAVSGGVLLCLLLTIPVAIPLFFFGGKLPFLFTDNRAFRVFRILLLGLSFSSVYAVIRGYFWGNKEFLAPSVMELAEEAVMVIFGVLLLQSVSSAAIGAEKAAWAVVISYLFSFSASLIWFFIKGGKLGTPRSALKPLFRASAPITAVRASGSLVNSAVAVLLPVMLIRAGYNESEALKLFGVVSGMVLPLLFIPSTLIGSLALVLTPELSEDFYRKNFLRLKANLARGLKVSFLISCCLIPFFFALGDDLGRIAYSNERAGVMLKNSCLLLLPMSLTMISTSMLNAMGHEKQTFIFYFVGAAAMLLCILFLPPFCGIYAYIVGLGASFSLTAICNIFFLFKQVPVYENSKRALLREYLPTLLFLPFLCVLGGSVNRFFSYLTGETLSFFATALLLVIVTLLTLLLTGGISLKKKQDFSPLFAPKRG